MKNGRMVSENLFRKARKHYLKGHTRIATLYRFILRLSCSCDVFPQTQIAENVRFQHNLLGCVIHPGSIIDEGCVIYQNVTLGGNTKQKKDGSVYNEGAPHIERNCIIFSGAVIAGPITIGEGSIIGANAVVTRSCPPHTKIVAWHR